MRSTHSSFAIDRSIAIDVMSTSALESRSIRRFSDCLLFSGNVNFKQHSIFVFSNLPLESDSGNILGSFSFDGGQATSRF